MDIDIDKYLSILYSSHR